MERKSLWVCFQFLCSLPTLPEHVKSWQRRGPSDDIFDYHRTAVSQNSSVSRRSNRCKETSVRGVARRRCSRIVVSHQDAAFVALKSRQETRDEPGKAQAPSNADHLSHCERTAARKAAMAVGYKQERHRIGGGNASQPSTMAFIHLVAIATLP